MIQKTNEGVKGPFNPLVLDQGQNFSKAQPNKISQYTPIAKEHSAIIKSVLFNQWIHVSFALVIKPLLTNLNLFPNLNASPCKT